MSLVRDTSLIIPKDELGESWLVSDGYGETLSQSKQKWLGMVVHAFNPNAQGQRQVDLKAVLVYITSSQTS